MMTCEECLSALATESLREMTPDSRVAQHCATCPDCARLTTMLRDREYETATVFNGLPPMSNPLTVAETALRIAQRRRVGRVAVMASGVALLATIGIVGATIVVPALNESDQVVRTTLSTETIPLTCLSPKQAADIINPYVRGRNSMYYVPSSGISAITVRGTRQELIKSRDLLQEFEQDPNAACRATATTLSTLRDELSKLQGVNPNPNPNPNPDKAPTTLLGKPGQSLLDMNAPRGTGPVVAPERASTAPKKP
jgi:hypothetical protein